MVRHPLEGFEVMYEVQRLPRESALSFKREIRESTDMDEDYAHFLLLSLDYHKECTNEGGNEGPSVVRDKLNNDVDEYEDGNKDEDDPDHKKFLANAKRKGRDEEDLDEVESKPFTRTVLENDSGIEPFGPVTHKEKGLVNTALKRQKAGKGRRSAKNITDKEEAADVDEDHALLLEKSQSSS